MPARSDMSLRLKPSSSIRVSLLASTPSFAAPSGVTAKRPLLSRRKSDSSRPYFFNTRTWSASVSASDSSARKPAFWMPVSVSISSEAKPLKPVCCCPAPKPLAISSSSLICPTLEIRFTFSFRKIRSYSINFFLRWLITSYLRFLHTAIRSLYFNNTHLNSY